MSTHRHIVRAALSAALIAMVPAAHSQMYRWIDSQGSVTYSNQLPSDMSVVRDLTVVLETPDKGPGDAHGPSASGDTRRPTVGEAADDPTRAGHSSEPHSSPRIAISPSAPEAVRDPCLRSSDPKCIERNKAAYLPGRGYAGSAIGATSGTTAGGSISGGGPAPGPAKITPPKASQYALPPGTELPAPVTGSSTGRK